MPQHVKKTVSIQFSPSTTFNSMPRRLNSGCLVWWQVPLPFEQSCQPKCEVLNHEAGCIDVNSNNSRRISRVCEASESRGADTVKIYMNWNRQSSIQNQQLHRGNDFLQIFRLFFAALGFLLALSKCCHSHTMLFRAYCSGLRSGRSTDFCLKLGCFLTYVTLLHHTGQSQSQLIYFYIQNYMQLSYHLSSVLKLLSTKSSLQ